ncbi:TKL/DRK protein kinase [Thecamonas trahens ATCC 50062]|uniref:TKL/DRK protein kinase n=1 Tax=Thecamonas trahens ATCC 50062 TaxID=461836 RepID=A0A0L0DFP7_THETB|nr:TKL/DRK protein kinase [Thecamonas trahens ATCC 50062]KNC50986.1 TKL/DRK protein kinase [Thecamonas trahens ATCC 50062]|eukprot:XP_013756456.1 TKL/DRK protein kinase [Thecamonas trahens ATCC 50062]
MAATAQTEIPTLAVGDLVVREKLGSGNFGTVYRAEVGGKTVAVKKLRYAVTDTASSSAVSLEIGFLKTLDHPHVVRLIALAVPDAAATPSGPGRGPSPPSSSLPPSRASRRLRRMHSRLAGRADGAAGLYRDSGSDDDDAACAAKSEVDDSPKAGTAARSTLSARARREIWLIMEYVERGSLFKVLHAAHPPPWKLRLRWAREIAVVMGMLHTHAPCILHRDLTSENVLVTLDDHIKLTDFGLSVDEGSGAKILRSFKPAYAAPEVWDALPYTRASDVFSFGVVLYELATLQDPVTALRQGHGVLEPPATVPAAEPQVPARGSGASSSSSQPGPSASHPGPSIPPRRTSTPAEAADALAAIQGLAPPSLGSESGVYTEHSESVVSESEASIVSFSRQVSQAVRLSPLVVPSSVPYELTAIIQQCWTEAPERRPSAQQILTLLPDVAADDSQAAASLAAASRAADYAFEAAPALVLGSPLQPVSTVAFARQLEPVRFGYACMDGSIHLVSGVEDGDESKVALSGHTKAVTDFDWSLSGDFVVSASLDKTARVWDAFSGTTLRIVYGKAELFAIRFHPLNNNLFVVGSMDKLLKVFNMSTGNAKLQPERHPGFAGDANGMLYAYSLSSSSGKLREAVRILAARGRGISSLDYAVHYTLRSSVNVVLAACRDKMVRVFRVSSSGSVFTPLTQFLVFQTNLALRAKFCPTASLDNLGLCFTVGSEAGAVTVYSTSADRDDADDGPRTELVTRLDGHAAAVVDLAWSADGRWLASGDVDGRVLVRRRHLPADDPELL